MTTTASSSPIACPNLIPMLRARAVTLVFLWSNYRLLGWFLLVQPNVFHARKWPPRPVWLVPYVQLVSSEDWQSVNAVER